MTNRSTCDIIVSYLLWSCGKEEICSSSSNFLVGTSEVLTADTPKEKEACKDINLSNSQLSFVVLQLKEGLDILQIVVKESKNVLCGRLSYYAYYLSAVKLLVVVAVTL